MTSTQKYSIVKFKRRLSKIQSLDDLNKSKVYIISVISKLNREINFSEQLEERIKKIKDSENVEFIKEWRFFITAKAVKLAENQLYQYIDQKYLASGEGINETFTDFYSGYIQEKINPFTKAAVSRLFTVLGIKSINKKVNKKTCAYIQVSYFNLNKAYSQIGLHTPRKTEIPKDFLAKLQFNQDNAVNFSVNEGCMSCGV